MPTINQNTIMWKTPPSHIFCSAWLLIDRRYDCSTRSRFEGKRKKSLTLAPLIVSTSDYGSRILHTSTVSTGTLLLGRLFFALVSAFVEDNAADIGFERVDFNSSSTYSLTASFVGSVKYYVSVSFPAPWLESTRISDTRSLFNRNCFNEPSFAN